jgi:hypothetical protein
MRDSVIQDTEDAGFKIQDTENSGFHPVGGRDDSGWHFAALERTEI